MFSLVGLILRLSLEISYYAWNWSKFVCAVWCSGGVVVVDVLAYYIVQLMLKLNNFEYTLVLGLQVSVGDKQYGKALILLGHFEFRFFHISQC